jgi:hypothetical protein
MRIISRLKTHQSKILGKQGRHLTFKLLNLRQQPCSTLLRRSTFFRGISSDEIANIRDKAGE